MANPPITVGEITDVPAPESAINAAYHQTVANRVCHRFATVAALNAWAAGNGSLAYVTATAAYYGRVGGAWLEIAQPSAGTAYGIISKATGVYNQTIPAGAATPLTNLSVTFTAAADRWYRTRLVVPAWIDNGSTGSQPRFGIWDGASAVIAETRHQTGGGGMQRPAVIVDAVESGLAGSITRRAVCTPDPSGSIQVAFVGSDTPGFRCYLTVEDCGRV